MTKPYIMLVDDEKAFVETMTKRLEKREFTVVSCFSGQDAIDTLATHKNLDVIILDVKMPGLDGIEALKEIKKISPLTEVIMLTGHATVESAIDGMKLGAFDYLMKPCEINILTRKIEDAAQKKHEHEAKIQDAKIKEIISKRGFD
jgi:DNA-binding NtrC family response regulator